MMKIIFAVPNECNPDFRVVKQAETLAALGHDVRVYCAVLRPTTAQDEEIINGVCYIRRAWSVKSTLLNFFAHIMRMDYPIGKRLAPSIYFSEQDKKSKIWIQNSVFLQILILPYLLLHLFSKIISQTIRVINKIFSFTKSRLKILRRRLTNFLVKIIFAYFKSYSLFYVFYKEICAEAPDVIYCHDGATLRLGGKVADSCGARFLFDNHELEAHRSPPLSAARRKFVEWEEKKFLPKAHRIFTVGDEIATYLEQAYGLERPIVLYNSPPITASYWPEHWAPNKSRSLREDIGVNQQELICIYTGNVAYGRGCEDMIIGLSKLRDSATFEGVSLPHFVMVGRVVDEVRAAMLDLARSHKVEEWVHFVDPVPAHSVVDYISTADISIIPVQPKALSYEYAMPNKLFEALLAGLPILGSNLTEMGPFIRENRVGRTFIPGDSDDLAQQLARIIIERDEYTDNHREKLTQKFSWEAQQKKLTDVFEKIDVERTNKL